MSTVVKLIAIVAVFTAVKSAWPTSFLAGYLAGVAIMALLELINSFTEGWRRAKARSAKGAK